MGYVVLYLKYSFIWKFGIMTNIDFSKLTSQYAINYDELSFDTIMNLYVYHPWDGGKNPNIDKITNTLLNLKSDKDPAVNFFSKVAKTQLLDLVKTQKNKSYCIVPSHSKGDISNGLSRVIANIKNDFGFSNSTNPLKRIRTVAKSSTGGDRSVQHHLDSIEVVDESVVKDKVVFLFDDISSTGNSMEACKKLLLEKGATKVVMISFGQTASNS
jgi:hypothetical protein